MRDQAQQLAEMADRLSGREIAATPGTQPPCPPVEDARTVAARLLQRVGDRVVRAQCSYAEGPHEFADPFLDRLHTQFLARNGEMRLLIPSGLLRDEEALARLDELAASGAQIRISPCELPTATVFDGRVGLLSSTRGAPLTVISDPETARAMSVLHNAVWARAVDLSSAHAGWIDDDSAARVLQAASRGYTDEKAARVLGLSVRTYRRRVAALLDRLDATSRFQAGVRAAQLGLIDASA
ncbi:helix-turn-helix transcriptional regulator [Peterkaempfera bronchialis]|uniref:helix-turn-helix transcriptional regulator n=1 Tax=Peterkaempfera bronchialis TaxID=2126346 RepID=UPI0013B36092|nr:response regulator transcription factor [Peterkaempfera bronchialis]